MFELYLNTDIILITIKTLLDGQKLCTYSAKLFQI